MKRKEGKRKKGKEKKKFEARDPHATLLCNNITITLYLYLN